MSSNGGVAARQLRVECLSLGVYHFGKRISASLGMARCHSMGRWFIPSA